MKKHCCRVCEPDSGYDVEMIEVLEEKRKRNAILIDEYFFKEGKKKE